MDLARDALAILDRSRRAFARDLERNQPQLAEIVESSSFLILGAAGSIGQAVTREIFRRRPRRLHAVDLSENNLVELVRDLRSSHGYIDGDFRALPLDCGSREFEVYLRDSGPFDFVLNLAAMKHVRSEKDAFSLMRMVRTNVLSTVSTLQLSVESGTRRYFAVSTDKAANPANAMGATKRAMELALLQRSDEIDVSSARFANVAFSDGSLLHGFRHRLAKRQPIAAPQDVLRYFITDAEAAILCLFGALLTANREAVFPRVDERLAATSFRTLAERTLAAHGYRAEPCATEDEARARVDELAARGAWPCFFFDSDTTGEKEIEEFTMEGEEVDESRFEEIGVIRWPELDDPARLNRFVDSIGAMGVTGSWTRENILDCLAELIPEFQHRETGKFLDSRM